MKLFVVCKSCGNKIYLKEKSQTRRTLTNRIGKEFHITCPHCNNKNIYNVHDVFAEAETNNAAGGAIIGGLIGLIGGPIGALSGSTIGGLLGYGSDENERKAVQKFNNSRI